MRQAPKGAQGVEDGHGTSQPQQQNGPFYCKRDSPRKRTRATPLRTLVRYPLWNVFPPKEYILVLKILAGRDQDLADCRILLPQTHIRTRQQAQRVLNRYILPEAQQDEAETIASSLDVLFGSEREREP